MESNTNHITGTGMISSGLALQVRYVAGVEADLLLLLSGGAFNLHNDTFFMYWNHCATGLLGDHNNQLNGLPYLGH